MAADLLQVLQQIVKSAREVSGADSSAIWSFDAVRDMFIPEELVADGIPAELVKKFHQEESSLGRVAYRVMERGWVGVGDIANPQYDSLGTSTRELLGAIGVKSFQGITLQVDDKKLGVLYINYNHARTFTGEDRHLLETFANHAALALSKARLLEQVTRIRETARVVAELTALGDLPRTLDSIVQGTQEALQCDAVTLYTYDQDRNKVDFPPAVSGVRDVAELIQPGMVARDSTIWKMLKLDGPHVAEDASSDPLMRGSFVSQAGIKSSVGIPLTVGDRKVGVMFVNYHSRHRFTADELTNTELLANQAAVAIRNAQLYEETIRRATALEALYEAGRAVTGTLELGEILNRVVEQAWRLAAPLGERAHFSHLALVDGNRVKIVAAHPPEAPIILDRVYGIEPEGDVPIGITGRTVVTCRPRLVGNVLEDPDYIEIDSRVRSQLSVPIQKGEQVIGVIGVEHPGYNAFDQDDQQALEALASQASIAIQNARQLRMRAGLLKAGEVVTAEGELYPALEVIAESVKETIGCDVVSLYTCDQEKSEISYPSVVVGELYKPQEQADWQLVTEDRRLPIDSLGKHSVIRKLLEHGLSRFAFCSAEDSALGAGNFVVREEIESSAGILLKIGEEVVGILFINYRSAHRFTDEERLAVELFAVQAALTIRSARRYEELRRTKGLVGARTALAWMGMASSAWRHAIDKHALTTREQIQLMRGDLQHSLPRETYATVDKRFGMIERLMTQILEKPIIPPLSVEEGVTSIVVNDLIRERARQLWQNEPYKSAKLQLYLRLDKTATVRASPEWLRRAFGVLVDNAVEAVVDCEVRKITIGTRKANGSAEIVVCDTGPGMPEEVLLKLFHEPIERPEDAKGLGMGLLMAQTIVQTYGGEIRVQSTGPKGTTMIIRLPLKR